MPKCVRDALKQVVQKEGKKNFLKIFFYKKGNMLEEEAENFIKNLEKSKRYFTETWD